MALPTSSFDSVSMEKYFSNVATGSHKRSQNVFSNQTTKLVSVSPFLLLPFESLDEYKSSAIKCNPRNIGIERLQQEVSLFLLQVVAFFIIKLLTKPNEMKES